MAKKKKNKSSILLLLLLGGVGYTMASGRKDDGSSASTGGSFANKPVNEAMLKNAFEKARDKYGLKIAGDTERLFRKETRNFESGQFRKTYTPGMEQAKGKDLFPYGWTSLNDFLKENPKYAGEYFLVPMTENVTGTIKKYVGFPTLEGAVMFVAYTIKRRGNAGYWRSFDEQVAKNYYNSLLNYPVKYT